ncbi:MAG: hypothetical protein ACP5OG_04495 [Candidatus Nanoarchaeia archaeon]
MGNDLSDINCNIPQEKLEIMCRNNLAKQQLDFYMSENFDELFARVPENIHYIMGFVNPVNLEEGPKLYAFTKESIKKAQSIEDLNSGKISNCIHRTQKEEIYLF